MTKTLIDKTNKYIFEKIYRYQNEKYEKELSKNLSTTFIHEGSVYLNLELKNGETKQIALYSGQGFILAPGINYSIKNEGKLIAYTVSSEVDANRPIMEIIDDGNTKEEVELKEYKIITNPKKVEKPWGHELWISWFKDYHVLKQIGMNGGKKSSLQFHRKKLETNYLESGRADVIDGYQLDPTISEEIVQASSKGVNFEKYRKEMNPGDHWTSHPGTVHRVISIKDYLAYEVSTPELDDVIRLQDDTGRTSGRIDMEHKK